MRGKKRGMCIPLIFSPWRVVYSGVDLGASTLWSPARSLHSIFGVPARETERIGTQQMYLSCSSARRKSVELCRAVKEKDQERKKSAMVAVMIAREFDDHFPI